MSPDEAAPVGLPRPTTRYRLLKRLALAAVIVLGGVGVTMAIGAVVVVVAMRWRHVAATRRVEAEVSRVRSAGEPLTTKDLYAYHEKRAGAADSTPLWLAALDTFDGRQLMQDGKGLPVVGDGSVEQLGRPEGSELLAAAEALLGKYEETLIAAHAAARAPGNCNLPVRYEDGLNADLSAVSDLRHVARLLQLELRVRTARGDAAGALESLEAIAAAAQTQADRLVVVEFLVGIALSGVVFECAEFLLAEGKLNDDQLAHLQKVVSRLDAKSDLPAALMGERAMGYFAFYNMGTLDQEKNSRLARFNGQLIRPVDCEKYLEVLGEMVACSHEPFPAARNHAKAVDARLSALMKSKNPLDKLSYMTTLLLAPAVPTVFDVCARSVAHRDATIAAIAAERFRRRTSALPARIDDLVPDFLQAVPQDPFDGKPLRWKVERTGLTIYSIGINDQDDGGVEGKPRPNEPDIVVRLPGPTADP